MKPKPPKNKLKIALIIDYFYWYGGAQKVEELILKIFPDADVFAGFKHPKYKGWIPEKVYYTTVQKLPFKRVFSPIYLLLLPFAFERLDFSQYDVVISSTQSFAKGVVVPPGVKHISYIHTPPRFLWGMESSRQSKVLFLIKPVLAIINHFLRIWDFHAAQRPRVLFANSAEVQKRIAKYYKCDSTILHPPTDVSSRYKNIKVKRDRNLFVSVNRLVTYKRVDLIIKAFKQLPDYKLVVAGTGDEEQKLKNLAGKSKNIKFVGFVSEEEKFRLFASANAFIQLSYEDFGLVPVESMAMGTPVIGLNAGGTRETVIDGVTGILIDELTVENVVGAIKKIGELNIKNEDCVMRSEQFGFESFKKQLLDIVSSN